MTINKEIKNNTVTLALCGRLDTSTAPVFEAELDAGLENCTLLVLDMTQLEYVSSAGLRVILKAQKLMNSKGSMKLTGVNDTVMEVFEITGFTDILTID